MTGRSTPQDPQPAEPVAATSADPVPAGAQPVEAGAQPEDAGAQPVDAQGADPGPEDADEMRRRYREALDRKQSHDSAGSGSRTGPGRTPGAQGGAHTTRMFRRKSG